MPNAENLPFIPVASVLKRGSLPQDVLGEWTERSNPVVLREDPKRTIVKLATHENHTVVFKQEYRPGNFVHERKALLALSSNWHGTSGMAPFPLVTDVDIFHREFLMERVPGKNVQERLVDNTTPLRMSEKVHIADGLLQAVDYAHSLSIAHLDIKPENIMYDQQTGRIALVDWGSSGHGETIHQCHIINVKPEIAPSGSTMPNVPNIIIQPPEIMRQTTIDGELADRYQVASALVQLFWGIDYLIYAAESGPPRINIGKLRAMIKNALGYDTRQDTILDLVTTNLSASVYGRRTTEEDLKLGLKELDSQIK